jgi:hypothetical protein
VCQRGRVMRPRAAGATWTSSTANALWAARDSHTTVVDAAGAIYVMGGNSGTSYLNDVWVSKDKGADRTRAVLVGYSKG